jgi:hypothetical protein
LDIKVRGVSRCWKLDGRYPVDFQSGKRKTGFFKTFKKKEAVNHPAKLLQACSLEQLNISFQLIKIVRT